MNKARRKRLAELVELLEDIKAELGYVRDDEQEAFDNPPESIQMSERGEAMETAISTMDDQVDAIDTIILELGEL